MMASEYAIKAKVDVDIDAPKNSKDFDRLIKAGIVQFLKLEEDKYFQNEVEESDRLLEMEHLASDPESELMELQHIYIQRGLTPDLAMQVAQQMHEKDALEAHLRDELGQHPHTKARPIQAAIASAISFTAGGLIPFAGAFAPTVGAKFWSIVLFTLGGLLITGIVSAKLAGSRIFTPTVRVMLGGSLGMLITAGIGKIAHISGL
jgi:VIT1/CCC1 family predicted Fe2+/Mn2+ transporter